MVRVTSTTVLTQKVKSNDTSSSKFSTIATISKTTITAHNKSRAANSPPMPNRRHVKDVTRVASRRHRAIERSSAADAPSSPQTCAGTFERS